MANKNFEVKHGLSVGGTERITAAGAGSFTDLALSGDLNITGDVNSVSVTDLDVTDKTITLGKGQTESNSGSSGIIIDGSSASMLWDESNDEFDFNKGINITGGLNISGDIFGTSNFDIRSTGNIFYTYGNSSNVYFRTQDGTNRVFISSAGRLAVGTTNPDVPFHVEGGQNVLAQIESTHTDGNARMLFKPTGNNGWNIGANNNGSFTIYDVVGGTNSFQIETGASASTLVVDSNSRVGIGTASPIANLDVIRSGATGLSSVNARTTALFQNSNSAGTTISINAPNTGYSGIFLGDPELETQGQIKMVHTTNTLEFASQGGAAELILQAGNIALAGGVDRRIKLSDSGVSGISTSDNTVYIRGNDDDLILNAAANGLTKFQYNGTERMRIDTSGKVGIGTTSPNANLHVGSSNATGDATNPAIQLGGANTYRLGLYTDSEAGYIENKNGDNGLVFRVKTAGEAMRIAGGTGDVLIGSSTNLDVLSNTPKIQVGSGTGHSSMQFYSGTGSVGALYFGDGTSGTDRYPGYIEYRHNNNTMAFRVNGTDHVIFLSNGQISCKNITATDSAGNVSVGYGALNVVQANSGDANVAVGYEALEDVTTGSNNTGIGYRGAMNITSGNYNTALGTFTMYANTSGSRNTALGYQALYSASGNDHNTAVGNRALVAATNNGSCTAVGSMALEDCTENGHNNTAIGVRASYKTTSGQYNTSLGVDALEDNQTGQYNTACGSNALGNVSGSNNSGLGYSAGKAGSPGGQLGNVSNRIVLGNGDITHLYCETSSISTSDERDKTDFTDLDIGLDFVKSLKPYTFRWDKRHKYVDWDLNPDTDLNSITNDGTHKDAQLDLGFKAQEVEALEVAAGYKKEDETNLVIDLTDDGTKYGIKYEKLVPILVKAIQELEARVKELEG